MSAPVLQRKIKRRLHRVHRVVRITYDQIRIRGIACKMIQTKVEVSCYCCYYETSDTSSSSRDSLKTWMFILFSKWIQRHLSYGVLSFSETVYLDFLWYARTKDHSWPPNSFWSYISWRSTYRNSSAVWPEFPFILCVTLKSFYYFHAFLVRLQSAVSYHKTEK